MAAAKRIVVVGGVAGGASVAARARRLSEKASIIIFEKGPDVSFANCGMPYYLGNNITDRSKLNVQTPQSLRSRLNLDVRCNTEVIGIDTAAKSVTVKESTGKEYKEAYDELVLAMGAKPMVPPIPGIGRGGNFALRSLQDMDACGEWLNGMKDQGHVVVAGGGFIGVEMAEQMLLRGHKVTLVERNAQLMAPFDPEMAALLQQEMEKHGITVLTGTTIKAFEPKTDHAEDRGSDVVLDNGERLSADMCILGLGVTPDSGLCVNAGIEVNARGGIVVDDMMRTSSPHVWAVGDAVEVHNPVLLGSHMVPLAGPANRQGRLVADNICGVERHYKGTYATAALKVFELTAACTGATEYQLKAKNIEYVAIHTHPASHATYYPFAKVMALKVMFSPTTRMLLGAQCVGEDGADKRIDVLATAMQLKGTIDDVAELELCYAPPIGSAKDPVNHIGFISQNIADGFVKVVTWDKFPALAANPEVCILDVRNPGELTSVGILHPNAKNIPLDSLRSRLAEVPRDRPIVVSCMTGQRSYYACRILSQEGFTDVSNLTGAFKTWSSYGAKGGKI